MNSSFLSVVRRCVGYLAIFSYVFGIISPTLAQLPSLEPLVEQAFQGPSVFVERSQVRGGEQNGGIPELIIRVQQKEGEGLFPPLGVLWENPERFLAPYVLPTGESKIVYSVKFPNNSWRSVMVHSAHGKEKGMTKKIPIGMREDYRRIFEMMGVLPGRQ